MAKLSKFRFFVLALFFPLNAAIADSGFVAGLNPSARPTNAPVITVFEPADAWKQQALRGIQEPQTGLGFLKDQGVWYTPFNRPNLPGRYDIRGLHDTSNKKKD